MTQISPSAAPADKPLSLPVFRALWIATIISNVGTWMHDVGAGWLMTSLSAEPLMVALVQAATTLPMFLLALPGGALADIVDRRKLLLAAQVLSLSGAAFLAIATLLNLTTPLVLLGLTAVIAIGAALSAPAFQAIVPELVPTPALQQAVALNSLGVNISRAIGPALGGVVIAAAGPAAVFALNAVSVVAVLWVLARWRRAVPERLLPPEHFIGALRAGLRYAMRAPELQMVLIRSVGFFFFASALWALLPIIARRDLGLGPAGYGALLTAMGLGAIAGALILPRLRGRVTGNALTLAASLLLALSMVALALSSTFWPAAGALALGGLAWISMMSALNGGAQVASPGWVKARALAIYLLVFQGAMTAGSTLWGALAGEIGITGTLMVAAAGLAVASPLMAWRFPLARGATSDLSPSMHWPAPVVERETDHDAGPVMVTVEYRIDPARMADFQRAMKPMQRIRRRDGAIHWGLYEDAAAPGLVLESFVVESWLEHLRQHHRITQTDRQVQETARAFHIGQEGPLVRHLISPATPRRRA